MKNYELHYADLELKGDIPVYGFKTFNDLVNFTISKASENRNKAVFLVAKDHETTPPFVTDNPFYIEFYLTKMPGMGFKSATFVQEYKSYEEAYKVALSMVEENPLCYS